MRMFRSTLADVPRMMECARLCCAEHGEERTGGALDEVHYEAVWCDLISRGSGVMFLVEDDGKVVAGIGGAKYRAPLTGRMRASQLFIYVRPAYRGKVSIRNLIGQFEEWAVTNECSDVVMPCMDSMPGKTKDFYEHRGYTVLETLYRKPLNAGGTH